MAKKKKNTNNHIAVKSAANDEALTRKLTDEEQKMIEKYVKKNGSIFNVKK